MNLTHAHTMSTKEVSTCEVLYLLGGRDPSLLGSIQDTVDTGDYYHGGGSGHIFS